MLYTMKCESTDFGTERRVAIYNSAGHLIGARDPFYPAGIPISEKARTKRIKMVAQEIIAEYENNTLHNNVIEGLMPIDDRQARLESHNACLQAKLETLEAKIFELTDHQETGNNAQRLLTELQNKYVELMNHNNSLKRCLLATQQALIEITGENEVKSRDRSTKL